MCKLPKAWIRHILQLDEPKTRTYHGRVGSGRRTAGPWGGAEPGKTGRRRVGSPRRQPSLAPPIRPTKTFVRHVYVSARTSEMPCKARGEQAVYPQFIRGTTAALRSWMQILFIFSRFSIFANLFIRRMSGKNHIDTNGKQASWTRGTAGGWRAVGKRGRAVYPQDGGRSSFLTSDQWGDAFMSPHFFHAGHVWQNLHGP